MATVTEIGSLISRDPEIRRGRPCIAGTGVSVRRIAVWHNMGYTPEEIVSNFGHLSLAQVHAALRTITPTKPRSTPIWKPKSVITTRSQSNTGADPSWSLSRSIIDEDAVQGALSKRFGPVMSR